MGFRILLILIFFSSTAIASPWFTGPILASNGQTVDKGHFNFETYGFYTIYPEDFRNLQPSPVLTLGLTHLLDIQASAPYNFSWAKNQYGTGIGDTSLGFGLQVFKQKEHLWYPSLRVVVQELFPTGRYENLNPAQLGTDQTGGGSYQTTVALDFQHLIEFQGSHYLRSRLNLVGSKGTVVKVNGVNAYGGIPTTHGKVNPGQGLSVDMAFEYTLTQHWVPVFEALYVTSSSSTFTGDPGIVTLYKPSQPMGTTGGNPGFTPGGAIGGAGVTQYSLAPALEYNFNQNLGIIGGVWFSISGPASAQYTSYVIALNYYL